MEQGVGSWGPGGFAACPACPACPACRACRACRARCWALLGAREGLWRWANWRTALMAVPVVSRVKYFTVGLSTRGFR